MAYAKERRNIVACMHDWGILSIWTIFKIYLIWWILVVCSSVAKPQCNIAIRIAVN